MPAAILGLAAKGKLLIRAEAGGYTLCRAAPPTMTVRDRLVLSLRRHGQCSRERLAGELQISELEVQQLVASACAEGITSQCGQDIILPRSVQIHLEEDARGLTPDELAVFLALLGEQDEVVITSKDDDLLRRASGALAYSLKTQYNAYFTGNLPFVIAGGVLSLLAPFVLMHLFPQLSSSATPDQVISSSLLIAVVTCGPAMLFWPVRHAFSAHFQRIQYANSLLLFVLVAYFAYAGYRLLHFLPAASLVLCYLLMGIILLFYHLLKNVTPRGREVLDQIAGMRLYLSVYPDEIRVAAEAPPQDTDRYHALLPYAYALDVEKQWAKHFTEELELIELGFLSIPVNTGASTADQPLETLIGIYPDYTHKVAQDTAHRTHL